MKVVHIFIILTAIVLAACAPTPATEAFSPRASPTADARVVVLIWERTGGFAGFCDKVVVHESGSADVFNCKGNEKTRIQLTDAQLGQLAVWQKTFKVIDYRHTDPAVADAMTVSLMFAGRGEQPADTETIRIIAQFASELATQTLSPVP